MEFSASITHACALQTIHTTYEHTYTSSTMSRYSGTCRDKKSASQITVLF